MLAFPQNPAPVAAPEVVQQLEMLGWVDRTALAVLVVFFVLGIFKGLIWQVSRIAILAAAYALAGRFGADVGAVLARTPAVGGSDSPAPIDTPETTLYLAYVLVFLGVLIVLSLLAMFVQKLAQKAGLGFFDRLGGGVLGVATGACVVLFGLFVVHMFFRGSQLAQAAETSHSLRLSRTAIEWLGETVPDDLRTVFSLRPLREPHGAPADTATEPTGAHGLPVPAVSPAEGGVPAEATTPPAMEPPAEPGEPPPPLPRQRPGR